MFDQQKYILNLHLAAQAKTMTFFLYWMKMKALNNARAHLDESRRSIITARLTLDHLPAHLA